MSVKADYKLKHIGIKNFKDWKGKRVEISKEIILELYDLIKGDNSILGVYYPLVVLE